MMGPRAGPVFSFAGSRSLCGLRSCPRARERRGFSSFPGVVRVSRITEKEKIRLMREKGEVMLRYV